MTVTLVLILAAALLAGAPGAGVSPDSPSEGAVVAIGGGGIPDSIRARIFALAGGSDAPILVIPFASERAEAGDEGVAAWREAGGTRVEKIASDPTEARAQLGRAKVLWFGGGDQNRLMHTLDAMELVAVIRTRHRSGAVLAGTSAGAAVMSRLMLTGEANLEAVLPGATQLAAGLGAWPGAIVDQHFLARRRMNRLIAAVLDHPGEVGVGIDERTAAIWSAGAIEVVGDGQVMVIDARAARCEAAAAGRPHAARDLRLHILRAGDPPWPLPVVEHSHPQKDPPPAVERRASL